MGNIQRTAWPALVVLIAVLLSCMLCATVSAQEQELSAAIRASLLTDPRSQALSSEELDSMVQALTAAALQEGITAEDIMWRPEEPEADALPESADTCGQLPKALCMLNEALGFSSGNLIIPLLLFFGSLALLFVLGLMVKMRHTHQKIPSQVSLQTPNESDSSM